MALALGLSGQDTEERCSQFGCFFFFFFSPATSFVHQQQQFRVSPSFQCRGTALHIEFPNFVAGEALCALVWAPLLLPLLYHLLLFHSMLLLALCVWLSTVWMEDVSAFLQVIIIRPFCSSSTPLSVSTFSSLVVTVLYIDISIPFYFVAVLGVSWWFTSAYSATRCWI